MEFSIVIELIKSSIFALFCTVGFSIIFNIPRKLIPETAICGFVGWFVYSLIILFTDSLLAANVVAAFCIGLLGEFFSIYRKNPSSIFIIPSIIPLVPGYGLYYTMLFVIKKEYVLALNKGAETLLIAVLIACGLMTANSLFRQLKLSRLKSKV